MKSLHLLVHGSTLEEMEQNLLEAWKAFKRGYHIDGSNNSLCPDQYEYDMTACKTMADMQEEDSAPLITYYYERHNTNSPRRLSAPNDEAALKRLRDEFGEHLPGVMIVYVEESKDNMRTVWCE